MALRRYEKKPITYRSEPERGSTITIKPDYRSEKVSAWEFLSTTYNEALDYITLSRLASLIIPVALILSGVSILGQQIWPEIEQAILEQEGYFDQGTVPLVAGDYITERQVYLSNPGSDYFRQLNESAQSKNVLQQDSVSNNYQGTFDLSIPSLDLTNLPVEANVNSGSEEIYDRVLERAIAHFQGTGLPISDVKNNIVLYGHSANGDYFERTQDPAGAFSRLQKIKIGDEITIDMEGETYKFKVYKTKIVNPDDTSIITGTPNRRELTLFTCFPNGNPAKRFVVVARPTI